MITAIMAEGARILANMMIPGNEKFIPREMYVEFKNVVSPSDAVTVPSFAFTDGVDYYAGLSDPLDYLRVPLGFLAPSASDDDYVDNILSMIGNPGDGGQTVGVNGLSFSSGSNSKIYGGAVVAILNPNDRSQDLQLCRFYMQGAEQFLFSPGSQKLIVVRLPFLSPDA